MRQKSGNTLYTGNWLDSVWSNVISLIRGRAPWHSSWIYVENFSWKGRHVTYRWLGSSPKFQCEDGVSLRLFVYVLGYVLLGIWNGVLRWKSFTLNFLLCVWKMVGLSLYSPGLVIKCRGSRHDFNEFFDRCWLQIVHRDRGGPHVFDTNPHLTIHLNNYIFHIFRDFWLARKWLVAILWNTVIEQKLRHFSVFVAQHYLYFHISHRCYASFLF